MSESISTKKSETVVYHEPMGSKATMAMYVSIGAVAFAALTILLYSVLTHSTLDKLIADPSLAAPTASRFFTLLSITLPIAGLGTTVALAIKIHHSCCGINRRATIVPGSQWTEWDEPRVPTAGELARSVMADTLTGMLPPQSDLPSASDIQRTIIEDTLNNL